MRTLKKQSLSDWESRWPHILLKSISLFLFSLFASHIIFQSNQSLEWWHRNLTRETYTMSSSFRRGGRIRSRPTSSSEALKTSLSSSAVLERVGTKPWVGGFTLTSSGLREFDAILGGGQPLGTAMLLEEDRWTQDLAMALMRYWAGEVSLLLISIWMFHFFFENRKLIFFLFLFS